MKKILYVTTIGTTINTFLVPHILYLLDNGYKVDIATNIDVDINKELINKIADIVEKNHTNLAEMAKVEKQRKLMMTLLPYYTCFKNAPVLVVVYSKEYYMIEETILRDNNASEEVINELRFPNSAAQGVGAAIENFLLAATELGYGTCYMTGPTHSKSEIEELINFEKDEYKLMAMISLGVAEEDTPNSPPRKPLDEVVTFID